MDDTRTAGAGVIDVEQRQAQIAALGLLRNGSVSGQPEWMLRETAMRFAVSLPNSTSTDLVRASERILKFLRGDREMAA